MVHTMEQFPEAALGISQKVVEDVKPYPFVMQPKETFKREFLMRGVLGLGPTGTIIKRDAFEILGGFTGTRYIGDTEMWYKLAIRYPVVKMDDGLTYWRLHDDQEITKGQDSFFYLENSYKLKLNTLIKKEFPLGAPERLLALKKLKHRFSRNLMGLIKQGHFKTANQIRKNCMLSWLVLLKMGMSK
tara:strand:- start:931 stop:1491 length:561 start_codon:yes stop_codon:yes gene_type:complete